MILGNKLLQITFCNSSQSYYAQIVITFKFTCKNGQV
jgi:hypothetical protein